MARYNQTVEEALNLLAETNGLELLDGGEARITVNTTGLAQMPSPAAGNMEALISKASFSMALLMKIKYQGFEATTNPLSGYRMYVPILGFLPFIQTGHGVDGYDPAFNAVGSIPFIENFTREITPDGINSEHFIIRPPKEHTKYITKLTDTLDFPNPNINIELTGNQGNFDLFYFWKLLEYEKRKFQTRAIKIKAGSDSDFNLIKSLLFTQFTPSFNVLSDSQEFSTHFAQANAFDKTIRQAPLQYQVRYNNIMWLELDTSEIIDQANPTADQEYTFNINIYGDIV